MNLWLLAYLARADMHARRGICSWHTSMTNLLFLHGRKFVLETDQFDALVTILDRPPQTNDRLAELFARPRRIVA